MRRLIAYLTLVFGIVFGVGANIMSPLKNMQTNFEYRTGQEFTYRISDKDNKDNPLAENAIDEVAEIMETRMTNFGISEFNIAKDGNNIIRTTTSLTSSKQYDRLRVYLNFNANFTVKIGDDDNTEAILSADELFKDKVARVEYVGPIPYIVFPLSDPDKFKTTIVDVAESIQNEQAAAPEEGQTESSLVKAANIVIWTDYDPDKDSYINPQGKTEGKIFLTLDYRNLWNPIDADDHTEIHVPAPLNRDENGNYTTQDIKTASETALYMVNVFNAGELPYDVEFLYANKVYAPSVEPLHYLGSKEHLALSATLLAVVAAFVTVLIISFVIYRLPILSAISSGGLTLLGTLLIFNAIMVELSTSAILGLVVVSLLSLISTLLYAAKFRAEVYKGRTFKKAHQEAITRSNLMSLDIMVGMILIGVLTYFVGGAALTGFATTLIFGSIVSIVSVLLHNSVVLWLLAHNTSTQKNYKMYGITESKVPNLLNDEKPSYFGRFAAHSHEQKSKVFTSVLGVLSLVSVVILSVFTAIDKTPFNLVKYDENTTRLYFQVSEFSDINPESPDKTPEKLVELIEYEGEILQLVKENGVALYETYEFYDLVEEGEVEVEVAYTFYVLTLNGRFTGEETVNYSLSTTQTISQSGTLADALREIVEFYDGDASISVNAVNKVATTPHFGRVALVSLLTLLLTAFYITLRFGLSRGLTSFITGFVSASVVLLFFIASRISVPPLVAIGSLVSVLFTLILSIIVFNQVKDIEKDVAYKDLTRKEKYALGLRHSLTSVYTVTLLFGVAFTLLTLLAPVTVSAVYVSGLIAVLVSLLVVTKFHTDTLSFSFNSTSKLFSLSSKLPKSTKVKKSGKQRTSIKGSSAEPEEAIYIGIND